MKKAKNVDDSIKKQFPSMKKAENVDDSMTDMPPDHKERTLEITSFLFPI